MSHVCRIFSDVVKFNVGDVIVIDDKKCACAYINKVKAGSAPKLAGELPATDCIDYIFVDV
jgi:hypothetical protein